MTTPLSPDALLAYVLATTIAATASPGETPAESGLRAAAIAAMFRDFAPRDAVAALAVSHYITLQFTLNGIYRDLASPGLDPKLTVRLRTQTVTMGRLLRSLAKQLQPPKAKPAAPVAKRPEPPAPETKARAPMKDALLAGVRAAGLVLPAASLSAMAAIQTPPAGPFQVSRRSDGGAIRMNGA